MASPQCITRFFSVRNCTRTRRWTFPDPEIARNLGTICGASWAVLGRSGPGEGGTRNTFKKYRKTNENCLEEPSGGASWRPQGASRGPRGPSGGDLRPLVTCRLQPGAMVLFSVSGGSWGSSWGPFGALLGPFWGPRGPCWGPFGPSSGVWEAFGRLGALLGASWALLGASLGPLGALMGPSWGPLGPSWGALEPLWAPLGPSWGPLGPCSDPLGGLLGCLGTIFGASWAVLDRSRPEKVRTHMIDSFCQWHMLLEDSNEARAS